MCSMFFPKTTLNKLHKTSVFFSLYECPTKLGLSLDPGLPRCLYPLTVIPLHSQILEPNSAGRAVLRHHEAKLCPFEDKPYGGFLTWGYPQIIHFSAIFHCKPSISGVPPFMETKHMTYESYESYEPQVPATTASQIQQKSNAQLQVPGKVDLIRIIVKPAFPPLPWHPQRTCALYAQRASGGFSCKGNLKMAGAGSHPSASLHSDGKIIGMPLHVYHCLSTYPNDS